MSDIVKQMGKKNMWLARRGSQGAKGHKADTTHTYVSGMAVPHVADGNLQNWQL